MKRYSLKVNIGNHFQALPRHFVYMSVCEREKEGLLYTHPSRKIASPTPDKQHLVWEETGEKSRNMYLSSHLGWVCNTKLHGSQ